LALALAAGAVSCGSDDGGASAGGGARTQATGKVVVLLPDSTSSVRWETVDRPALQAAFDAAGVEAEILNAEGERATQLEQAGHAIADGAKVILQVSLDSGTGAAIAANAASQDVHVIDYDRLTLDTDATDYYVSFDNEQVGRLQAEGLVDCVEAAGTEHPRIAILNGAPTDNNATLSKRGADEVLDPRFAAGDWIEIGDRRVPDWDQRKARAIFERMLDRSGDRVDGVLAANDSLAGVAVDVLKERGLPAVPVTGQDATLQGVQRIVTGDQCMTVYKAIAEEAGVAAELAIALARGHEPAVATTPVANGAKDVPAVLLDPVAVDRAGIADHVDAPDFPKREEICSGRIMAACPAAGL
jgi:D-xylose transport system substrate-binding protein